VAASMNLSAEEARQRFGQERVARMATVDEEGRPHVVVHTFAAEGDWIFHAVDHKPKRSMDLARVRNIRAHPAVSVLVDHYSDDWEQLWWVRADGTAYILEDDEQRAEPVRLLAERYAQYRDRPPEGPVIAVEVARWSGWSYAPTSTS
jgi:PPOX class probable F420-dependent enzyme